MADDLTESRIADLLGPYVEGLSLPADIYASLAVYLNLLLRWNARTNLTAVRDPEQLVQRQAGESLMAAHLVQPDATVLDFGSGAGFPGIPLQLALPSAAVTLAECQGKKASFLREAVRALALKSAVWSGRVEGLPGDLQFDVVTMRAVDETERMVAVAAERVAEGGCLLRYIPSNSDCGLQGWKTARSLAMPVGSGRLICQKRDGLFHVEPDAQPA